MNPRQRRGVLLLALSVLGAVAVFGVVVSYVSEVRSQVDPKVRVLRLTRDVPALSVLSDAAVEQVEVPRRWAPRTALRERDAVASQVAGTDLQDGSILQEGMLIEEPDLVTGQRELAILVDAETGVAGKVRSGNIVDIQATFAGDASRGTRSRAQIIVAGARIIDVGQPRRRQERDARGETASDEKVPVTFALSVEESLRVAYAESFATDVRLALLRPGEESEVPFGERSYTLEEGAGRPPGPGGESR